MTAFNDVFYSFIALLENPKFATEWTRTPPREITIKKTKFSTSEFTKICHFEITKQKKCPLRPQAPLLVGGEHPLPTLHSFGASSSNFELALKPLALHRARLLLGWVTVC